MIHATQRVMVNLLKIFNGLLCTTGGAIIGECDDGKMEMSVFDGERFSKTNAEELEMIIRWRDVLHSGKCTGVTSTNYQNKTVKMMFR